MRLVHFIILIITTTSCIAQPFDADCTAITSSPHLDQCVDKMMKVSNAHLQDAYLNFEKRATALYVADQKLAKELIKKARKVQDAWIVYRELNCNFEAFEIEEGTPAYITTVKNCITRMNTERIKVLNKLLH